MLISATKVKRKNCFVLSNLNFTHLSSWYLLVLILNISLFKIYFERKIVFLHKPSSWTSIHSFSEKGDRSLENLLFPFCLLRTWCLSSIYWIFFREFKVLYEKKCHDELLPCFTLYNKNNKIRGKLWVVQVSEWFNSENPSSKCSII